MFSFSLPLSLSLSRARASLSFLWNLNKEENNSNKIIWFRWAMMFLDAVSDDDDDDDVGVRACPWTSLYKLYECMRYCSTARPTQRKDNIYYYIKQKTQQQKSGSNASPRVKSANKQASKRKQNLKFLCSYTSCSSSSSIFLALCGYIFILCFLCMCWLLFSLPMYLKKKLFVFLFYYYYYYC